MNSKLNELKEFFEEEVEKYGERVFSKNNKVSVRGILTQDFIFSHEVHGKKFYKSVLQVKRHSEESDNILLIVSEEFIGSELKVCDKVAEVRGCYRSRNEGSHLILYLHAKMISITEKKEDEVYYNNVYLNGYICKPTVYRITTSGWEICDVMLAVNENVGRSSYIPCIAWNNGARYLRCFRVGRKIEIYGRIQSRVYDHIKEVYEVSVTKFEYL